MTTHGYSTYANHGFRCDVCRAANAEYQRGYRRRSGQAYQRAYTTALGRLRDNHRDEFTGILAELTREVAE